jgi:nucleotide-binding universal stress UspA family protein
LEALYKYSVSGNTNHKHLMPPDAEMWRSPECLVQRGDVAESILEFAKRRDADLIVLGMHKAYGVPGAATHLPMTTMHKVMANAQCPALTVRD